MKASDASPSEPPRLPRELQPTLTNARKALLGERLPFGHWEGELSSSALSTATAISALALIDKSRHGALIQGGLDWLTRHQNEDGGWGDTILSFSNISTTLLCWSAFGLADRPEGSTEARRSAMRRVEGWIRKQAGGLEPEVLAAKVAARYGKDRTFSVPILMLCALGGRLGPPREAWKRVSPLPFEMAAFPRRWYAALRLPVVSYALPALIAIGYARYFHAPPAWPARAWRRSSWKRVSRLLADIQPESGGFLEATPLTSFVSMALAGAGQVNHPVIPRAAAFLQASVRADGSWPIDTNLTTWGTTLATKALLAGTSEPADLSPEARRNIRDWLLRQQYREVHPYTVSPPGGWAWTDLSGGVPDGDDTPGALLALHALRDESSATACLEAAKGGIDWLIGLQNRDGGIPTFCRGWGALPFDRSAPDLTAHALRAWRVWLPHVDAARTARVAVAIERALAYLKRTQDADGAWTPLWFGNQHAADEANRTYGTALVLSALADLGSDDPDSRSMAARAATWLMEIQQTSGGWGGDRETPPSIEETALALGALARWTRMQPAREAERAITRGVRFLTAQTAGGTRFPPSPIGFYFAKLWYYEKLYPMVWTVEALENVSLACSPIPQRDARRSGEPCQVLGRASEKRA